MVETSASGWPKKITVERKIVNLLSRSLYTDFPRAIREAISNSFDGDATEVKIKVDRKNKEVVIEDNGNGISVEQFDSYLSIARQKQAEFTEKFHRKRIGQFGVGFLAGFPFCTTIEITSKREGSDVGFTAIIPTKRFVEGTGVQEDISSIPVDGFNEPYLGKMHEHYTRIRMSGLTETAEEYFRRNSKAKSISIESWDGMERLKWQLCETLPLDYNNKNSDLAKWMGNEPVGMEVWLNGERLFRNESGEQVLASSQQTYVKLGNLEFKYAITTDWKIIHPVEARGLKVRIRNVGIGSRTYLEIEKEVRTYSRIFWIAGEVNVITGLDESLTLTRDSFIWSSNYQALKEFFSSMLGRVHARVETVGETEKEISHAFRNIGTPPTLAAEIIRKRVKQLENLGFEILHKSRLEVPNVDLPLSIDKRRDIVTVIDDYGKVEETSIPSVKEVRVVAFEKAMADEPVRLAADGTIELNATYPLFVRERQGKIMKPLYVFLFEAKQQCSSVDEMYDYLVRRLKEEFG